MLEKKELEFGTAGIRGIMQDGPHGINADTVRKTAAGYAKFILEEYKDQKNGIVIGHDTRKNSYLFADIIAKTLVSFGVKATLYKDNSFQPTPLVSYTIRKGKYVGGVIITASHNPKEYNGIKVYDHTGKQLLADGSLRVATFMKEKNVDGGIVGEVTYLDDSIIETYVNDLHSIKLREDKNIIKVAFTPVQGTGGPIATRLLTKEGINFVTVEDQMTEDTSFAACDSLNPEEDKAYNKLFAIGLKNDCDACFITDPDADRVGIGLRTKNGYVKLNGNEAAALYLDYKLNQLGKVENGFVVTTVPSGQLAQAIAKKHGLEVVITHVGFKNVALEIEKRQDKKLILAYEESYGCIISQQLTRDKDSFQAILAYSEMINCYKLNGIDPLDKFAQIQKEYGHIINETVSLIIDEAQQKAIFDKLLSLDKMANQKIVKVEDYRPGINGLEKQNLLKIYLESGTWFAMRPSGTEPKVKAYIEAKASSKEDALATIEAIKKEL